MPCTADLVCTPCGQVPWPGTEASIPPTVTPTMVAKVNGGEDETWSVPPPSPHPNPRPERRRSAQQQSRPMSTSSPSRHGADGGRAGIVPELTLPEDRKIGDGHRSSAIAVSAKQLSQAKSGNTDAKATYLDFVAGAFLVEVFSGSGRLAASVRKRGLDVFEFDLTRQGGRRNFLHANVLHELRALVAHPMCRGIWFGFPCGTFSSARRNDGGPAAIARDQLQRYLGFTTPGWQRTGTLPIREQAIAADA